MANWTKETVERVEGEIVSDGKENQAQTPNGNPIGPEEKKKGFFAKAGDAAVSFGKRLWHAPTWAKVAVGSAVGLGAGYLIGKLTGQEQEDTQDFVPVRIDWTTEEEVPEIPEIPEMPAVEEITDADEISAATERLSDAVEQIIAPVEAMEVTTE